MNKILCCDASCEAGVLAIGDNSCMLKLFKYPALCRGSLHKSFMGHGAPINNVKFSHNNRYLLTLGGFDRCIFLWSHENEACETSDDESDDVYGPLTHLCSSSLLETVRDGSMLSLEISTSRSWLGSVVEPSHFSSESVIENGSTDVDIQLEWIHGYRCHDCVNNALYNSSGDVVYMAARVCVVFSRLTGKQRFLRGAHSKDIIGIASHPGGRLFVTADDEFIVIWDSETLNVIRKLENKSLYRVSLLNFSQRGDYIYVINADTDNTLTIYDWAKGVCLLKTSTSKHKVLCLCPMAMDLHTGADLTCSHPVEVLAVGGHKYLKFIWNYGPNIKCQKGLWGSVNKEIITAVASAMTDICVCGTMSGNLLIWYKFRVRGKCGGAEGNVHRLQQSPVQTIWCGTPNTSSSSNTFGRYVSADSNGQIAIWELASLNAQECFHLECLLKFNIADLNLKPASLSISTVCEGNGVLLIGTRGNEIFEVPYASGEMLHNDRNGRLIAVSLQHASLITGSHASGELWGLSMHKKLQIYATSGDDCYARFWTLDEHKMLHKLYIGDKSRCICINPIGDCVAIGLNSGKVLIFNISLNKQENGSLHNNSKFTFELCKEVVVSQRLIQIVKYSFDSSLMAVGSHDSIIYIFSTEKYELISKCKGHSSYITQLDFGIVMTADDEIDIMTNEFRLQRSKINPDDIFLQSNCAANELRYWRCTKHSGTEVCTVKDLKKVSWATCSCTRSWSVQGVWPMKDEEYCITALSTSNSWRKVPVLAACSEDGTIRIFNYPCLASGSVDKCYTGHSVHITNIGFCCNDSYLISIGGNDRCIFVWATDIIEEARERCALSVGEQAIRMLECSRTSTTHNDDHFKDINTTSFTSPTIKQESLRLEKKDTKLQSCKSFTGDLYASKKDIGESSRNNEAVLELSHVYGYRGWDCRNNIMFCDSSNSIAYHIAGIGIVHGLIDNAQILNVDHDNGISCMCVHPEGHIIASGDIAPNPRIILWDARTGVTIRSIKYHTDGISHVSFCSSGSMIISLGADSFRTVAVHNTQSGTLLGTGKIGLDIVVHAFSVNSCHSFLSGGNNHLKFWELPEPSKCCGELSSKTGLFGRIKSADVVSAIFLNGDAVTGMSDGALILWKGRAAFKTIPAHSHAVTSISNVLSNLASNKIEVESIVQFATGCISGCIYIWNGQLERVWSFNANRCTPIPALQSIQALALKHEKFIFGTSGCEIYEVNMRTNDVRIIVNGHFGVSCGINGLAVHPNKHFFATCSDDMTVRVFNYKIRRLVSIASMESKARSITYSPDGYQLAVGLHDGMIKVISEDLAVELSYTNVASSSIEALAYSPNGHLLAVSSNDCMVYILDSKSYFIRNVCRGHTAPVVHLDFSSCGKLLQTASSSQELRFWSSDGSPLLNGAAARDVVWNTWTSVIGWPVQVLIRGFICV